MNNIAQCPKKGSLIALRHHQAAMIETRILEELYYPMWYRFNVGITGHEPLSIAVFKLDNVTIECSNVDNEKDEDNDEIMRSAVFSGHSYGDYWEISIRARDTDSDYGIGISCPNQARAYRSITGAMCSENDKHIYCYARLTDLIDNIAEYVKEILDTNIEPEWIGA